jgi:hypothetical protein
MALYEIETPDGALYEIEAESDAQLQSAIAQLTGESQKADEPTQSAPSLLDQLKRQGGLAGRSALQGVTDLASLPGDLAVSLFNAGNQTPYEVTLDDGSKVMRGGPNDQLPLPSQSRDDLLTQAGLPEPETASERIVNLAGRGMSGGASFTKAASQAPGEIAHILAQRPTLQTVSGGTGGASAGVAREQGAGPTGQMLAALIGSMSPALLAPRAPVPTMTQPTLAEAAARVTPGQAAAESVVNAAPTARATGGGYTFGHVGPDASAGLTPTMRRVAARGQELGMRMTPGQATGSRALQQLEAKLESQPMTSGPFNTIKANNARVVNREAAASIGERGDVVDDVVMGRAADRIGDVYESVKDDVARPIEPRAFIQFLGNLQDETRGVVTGLTSHPLVEDVIGFATKGQATGRQLQPLASKLGKAAYKNMTTQSGDRDLGIALYRVKDYVDDLLSQGLSPKRAQTFDEARQQYRNLMLLTQRTGVVNPASGDVNARALANLLQSKDRRGYTFGENHSPLYDAARFGQAFGPIVGDSGTATRMPLQGVTDLLTRIPLNLATRAYTSSPGVNMAVRAQSAGRSVADTARGLGQPLSYGDVPASGAAASLTGEDAQRRVEAIVAQHIMLHGLPPAGRSKISDDYRF